MKVAMLFPGYGSQFVGMGKELYDEYRIVQEYFEEASHCLNSNFVKLCFASSDAELGKLAHAYTSLFLIGSSIYAVLKENGIEPDIVAGYNNGEVAGLFAAGCFSFPDGLYLLNKFCSFYEEFVSDMDVDVMYIKGATSSQLEKKCNQISDDMGQAFVALYDSPKDHFIAGNREQLEKIQETFADLKSDYVGIQVGLHSPLMNNVVNVFKDYLEKVDFKDLKIPLISSIDGSLVTLGKDVKDRFIRNINEPLKFYYVLNKLNSYNCIIIASPGKDMYEMIKKHYPEKIVILVTKKVDVDALKEIIIEKH